MAKRVLPLAMMAAGMASAAGTCLARREEELLPLQPEPGKEPRADDSTSRPVTAQVRMEQQAAEQSDTERRWEAAYLELHQAPTENAKVLAYNKLKALAGELWEQAKQGWEDGRLRLPGTALRVVVGLLTDKGLTPREFLLQEFPGYVISRNIQRDLYIVSKAER